MLPHYDYDLIAIGSGPAGEKGAAQAAYFGKKVALIEQAPQLGGAGLNTGTLPSKTLRESALYFSGLRQRGLYGIDYSIKEGLTVEEFMCRKQAVLEQGWKMIGRNLARHHIDLVQGVASLQDAHTVLVQLPSGAMRTLTAEIVLIATGSTPYRPGDVPFDDCLIYDSDTILHMQRIPKALTVIGGGVIGSEYASLFAALGVRVTLVDGRDRLLPFVDAEIAERLRAHLAQIGVRCIFNRMVQAISCASEQVHITLDNGEVLHADSLLYAAGRQSNVAGLGLKAVGVQTGNRGLILVNAHYQTSVPTIYAAGDVIGFPALASTAMEQARVAMVHAFNLHYKEAISQVLPLAVYTVPEIAMVGLSEEDCQAKGIPYLVGRAYYAKNPRGQIIGDLSGMLKLVFSPADTKLLGVHLIGEQAAELVHLGAQILSQGGTLDAFIHAVYNYPTLSDSYKYAAYDGLGQRQQWLLTVGVASR